MSRSASWRLITAGRARVERWGGGEGFPPEPPCRKGKLVAKFTIVASSDCAVIAARLDVSPAVA